MSAQDLDESIRQFSHDQNAADTMQARICVSAGDIKYYRSEFGEADSFYKRGLKANPVFLTAWIKRLLLHMGDFGIRVRDRRKTLRNAREADLVAKVRERMKSGIRLKEI
jgi:hypothetical protein